MKKCDFVYKIIEMYHNSKNLTNSNNGLIQRGRSRTISGYVEDLTALYLSQNLPSATFMIDQPFNINGRTQPFYPDITVIKDNVITDLIDIKLDLGFGRTKQAQEIVQSKWQDVIDSMKKEQEVTTISQKIRQENCNEKSSNKSSKIKLQVCENVKCHIVIISEGNGKCLICHKNDVFVYVMTSGLHPNDYSYSLECKKEKIQCENDLDRLISNIKVNLEECLQLHQEALDE